MKGQTNEYAFVGVENVGVVTELVRSFHVRTYRYTQHWARCIDNLSTTDEDGKTRNSNSTSHRIHVASDLSRGGDG